MGCKVSKTIVMGPPHGKSPPKQGVSTNSPESASLASSAPTTVPAVDSSFSTSRSSSPLDGPELSSQSNLVVAQDRIHGEIISANEVGEIALDCRKTDASGPAKIVGSGWPGELEAAKAGSGTTTDDDVAVTMTARRASEARQSTPEHGEGVSGHSNGNADLQPSFAGRCCNGVANGCTGADYSTNFHKHASRNKCRTAPSSPEANYRPTPQAAIRHSTEGAPPVEAYVCLPASTPPESGTATPPVGKPPLTRNLGLHHAKAIKITSVTVLQQPDTSDSLYGATIVTNGVTVRNVEDGDQLRSGDPVSAHPMQSRNFHTNTLDQPPSCWNGGRVKVTNSHTVDYVHSFLTNHVNASQGPPDKQNVPKQHNGLGRKAAATGHSSANHKTSPRIVNVTNSSTQYVMNDAGQKIAAVHQALGSTPSTPEARAPVPTSPFPYGGLGGLIDPADCSTLPSLESRRKLPPIQTTLSKASQLKLPTQTVDPFTKPSLQASTPTRDTHVVMRSSSPSLFREVEVESPDSSPSSTSTRPDVCRASIESSSSSSDCSSDTMIGSRFKETLEKAETNASGWTSIEEFLSSKKSPNINLLELETSRNPTRSTGASAFANSLEVQEDHALAFETSKIRYNNFNNPSAGTTRSFFQSDD